jgi:hypothetical protein
MHIHFHALAHNTPPYTCTTDLGGEGESGSLHTVNGVRLWVHVADPTRWLAGAPGSSELMQEAAERGRSMYFPWCVCASVCM